MIVPRCGFSFAVSGRTIPLFVVSSRPSGFTTIRSPSGRSFVAVAVAITQNPPCEVYQRAAPVVSGLRPKPIRGAHFSGLLSTLQGRVLIDVDLFRFAFCG